MSGLDNDPGEMLFVLNPQQQEPEDPILKKRKKKLDKYYQEFNKVWNSGNINDINAFIKKGFEQAKKGKYRLLKKEAELSGYIYDIKTLVKNLKINERTIRDWIYKDWEKDINSRDFNLWKSGTRILFHKEKLYKFISKNSYKYEKGVKISPCNYDRLPEYLKIEECAKILKLENRRQFRRNYIDNNPARLEGVKILKIGSTVRIEKESFLRYVEKLGGEKAK